MSRLSEERLKEADHSRMRDESGATFVLVEENGEPTIVPFLLPDSRPTRLNLLRDRSGIATGLVRHRIPARGEDSLGNGSGAYLPPVLTSSRSTYGTLHTAASGWCDPAFDKPSGE